MIGYLAANDGTASGPAAQSAGALMRATGRNVGNLAFWYATRRLFDDEVTFVPWKTKGVALPTNLRALVIPAANFIGAHANLAPIIEIIRELDVPTLVVGLGAQSESEAAAPAVNGTVTEFLAEAARRAPYLAVRGEYSAQVCRDFGVPNVKALGCPSVLMNKDQDLGKLIAGKIAALEPDHIAIHAACRKGNLTNVEREFIRYVNLYPGSSYVVQRPPELAAAIFQDPLMPADSAYLGEMAQFLAMRDGADELQQFLRRFGYVPTSIDSWSAFLRRFSCSINTRIHGTMIALQTGIPALCVTHDTRTRELATRMKMPALDVPKFVESRYDIKRLFQVTRFDGAAFDAGRREVAHEYVTLFKTFGLTPSRHLLAFTQERSNSAAMARVA